MNRLLLFNCSNDLALASNTREFIAPKNIAAMESDLATLPAWWAEDGDAILLDNKQDCQEAEIFFKQKGFNIYFTSNEEGHQALCKRTGKEFAPSPWGWSKAAVERYKQFGTPKELLPDETQINEIRALSSREFAAKYISELLSRQIFNEYKSELIGMDMRFIHSLKELETPHRTIFKSPWSSSGRGIFSANSIDEPSIREKLNGFIKRQGGFLADKLYNKSMDFALEFFIDENGTTHFVGYSLFNASNNGYYGYNIVDSQSKLRETIIANGCSATLLDKLISYHCEMLSRYLSGKYSGTVGIDMITASENGITKIHPCIEINLRMNIGVLALSVEKRGFTGNHHLTPTPKGKKGFYAMVSDSKLIIGYNK